MRHQLVTVITVSRGFVYPSKFILIVEIHCFGLLSVLDKLYRREIERGLFSLRNII